MKRVIEALRQEVIPTTLAEWHAVLNPLADESERQQVEAMRLNRPIRAQLDHMMQMTGVPPRDWGSILPLVRLEVDERQVGLAQKMVQACRYQGFDPRVLARLFVSRWRAARTRDIMQFLIDFHSSVLLYQRNSSVMGQEHY